MTASRDAALSSAVAPRSTLPNRTDLYLLGVVILLAGANRVSSPRLTAFLARTIPSVAYRVSRQKRAVLEQAVSRICGPEVPAAKRATIVQGAFYTAWDEIFGLLASKTDHGRQPDVHGRERVEDALREGRGAILWESGFFGRRNLAKQALRRLGFRIHQVHRETHAGGFRTFGPTNWVRDRIVRRYFDRLERQFVEDVIYFRRSDSLAFTRTMLERLERNEILCITADARYGRRLIPQRLLGGTRQFATGMVSLARTSGARLLPLFCVDAGGRMRVIVEPAVEMPSDENRDVVVDRVLRSYAQLLDGYVRRHPDQYRNVHALTEGST